MDSINMNFPPRTPEDFDVLIKEYSGQEDTACIFACVKDGDNPVSGCVGDTMAVLTLLVILIQQVAKSTDAQFSDILGALSEIDSLETI